jgi:hypothetical protein
MTVGAAADPHCSGIGESRETIAAMMRLFKGRFDNTRNFQIPRSQFVNKIAVDAEIKSADKGF